MKRVKAALQIAIPLGILLGCLYACMGVYASQWVPSAGASDLTTVQTCNAVSTQGTLAPQKMVNAGATSGSYSFSQAASVARNFELYSSAGMPGNTSWASGTWTVQIDVTAAASKSTMVWRDTCIIRVNSTGTAQTTEGSLTGQSIALNATGTKSMSITQAATDSSASATDRIVAVLNFNNGATSTQSFTLQAGTVANEFVTGPVIAKLSASPSDSGLSSETTARVSGFSRGPSDAGLSAESTGGAQALVRMNSDGTLSEGMAALQALARSVSAPAFSAETVSAQAAHNYSAFLSETAFSGESVSPQAGYFRSATDPTFGGVLVNATKPLPRSPAAHSSGMVSGGNGVD